MSSQFSTPYNTIFHSHNPLPEEQALRLHPRDRRQRRPRALPALPRRPPPALRADPPRPAARPPRALRLQRGLQAALGPPGLQLGVMARGAAAHGRAGRAPGGRAAAGQAAGPARPGARARRIPEARVAVEAGSDRGVRAVRELGVLDRAVSVDVGKRLGVFRGLMPYKMGDGFACGLFRSGKSCFRECGGLREI